ncbi:MAG: lipid II:glycine glycyltransferase FemX [Candidatus Hodarchaeales archaeon]
MGNETGITIKTHVDVEAWIDFIQKCPQKEIFQTPFFKDVINKTKYHCAYSFFAVDSNEQIVGSLLAYTIQENVPFAFLSRRAIVEGGPLFLDNTVGKQAAKLLVESFYKKIKKHAIFGEVRNHRPSYELDYCFTNINHNYIERQNILIDVNEDESEVWRNLHRRKAGKIKQAIKRGVTCKRVETKSEMKELYHIIQQTYKRVKVPLEDESLFISIFEELVPKELAHPLISQVEGKIIGGIVPLTFEGTIYAWFMAGLREYSNYYHQNDFIVWELLKWGCANNFQIFDFGGDIDPDMPSGIRDFKMRFGGRLTEFPRYQMILRPKYYKISSFGFRIWNKYYSGLRRKILSKE